MAGFPADMAPGAKFRHLQRTQPIGSGYGFSLLLFGKETGRQLELVTEPNGEPVAEPAF